MARNKRILVIRLSALGDVAMVCTMLRQAAAVHPDRDYTLLSRPRMEALLTGMPANVHFLPWPKEQKRPAIDWQQYDTVIDAHSVWRSLAIDIRALLHGKRVHRLHKPRLGRWLRIHHLTRRPLRSMTEAYRRLLDVPEDSPTTPIGPLSSGRRGIGIAPFAAHWGKIYPLSRMEQVIAALSQTGEPIYLFGAGPKEQAVLEQWEAAYPNVQSMAGRQPMDEELRIMSHLRVMLTMDSGNMHLASLAGTRAISVWGATTPALGFEAYGQQTDDCIGLDLPCRPCSVFGKKPCRYGDYRCMHIDPQIIIQRLATDH